MNDRCCVSLLRWALPRLGLRWAGFRKVRRQVCRRIGRRIEVLGLEDIEAYRQRLERDPSEWLVLDELCRVTISRFLRDRGVWQTLAETVLPALSRAAQRRGEGVLRCWSAGCASGEEPHTLSLIWSRIPWSQTLALEVVATDRDPVVLGRARRGCYPEGCLRELPADWRAAGFSRGSGPDSWCLRAELKAPVQLLQQDLRHTAPAGRFDLVLCRNLAFTYFDQPTRQQVAARLARALVPGGVLVLGKHEALCPGPGFEPAFPRDRIHRRLPHPLPDCVGPG